MALHSLASKVILRGKRDKFRIRKRLTIKDTGSFGLSSIKLLLPEYLTDESEGKELKLVAEGMGWLQLIHDGKENPDLIDNLAREYDHTVFFDIYVGRHGLALPILDILDPFRMGYFASDQTVFVPGINPLERSVLRYELDHAVISALTLDDNRERVGTLVAETLEGLLPHLRGMEYHAANGLIVSAERKLESAKLINLAQYN
jgi:hypothetical protein